MLVPLPIAASAVLVPHARVHQFLRELLDSAVAQREAHCLVVSFESIGFPIVQLYQFRAEYP